MTGLQRLAVSVFLACLVTSVTAMAASAIMFPLDSRRFDAGAGRNLFAAHCSSCHSLASTSAAYGPSLHNIGEVAASRRRGVTAELFIYESIVDPAAFRVSGESGQMPDGIARDLSAAQLADIVTFLCEQGGRANYRAIMALPARSTGPEHQIQVKLNLASIDRGKDLFYGKRQCSSCHWLDGSPGASLRAPRLSHVGSHSREELRLAILDPNRHVAAVYRESLVVAEGVLFSGRQLPSSPDSIRLLQSEPTGGLVVRSFSASELDPSHENGGFVRRSSMSPMPVYDFAPASDELEALLDFLMTIR